MKDKKRGYSNLVRPILHLIDLLIISIYCNYLWTDKLIDLVFILSFWLLLSVFFSFYNVYRSTKVIEIISLLFKQLLVYGLTIMSYFYIISSNIYPKQFLLSFFYFFILFAVWRIVLHFLFIKYRLITGSNFRQVIVIGSNEATKRLINFFNNNQGYGYHYQGCFTDKHENNKLGDFKDCFAFMLNNNVDEIYCSVKELSNNQISQLIFFTENNLKTIKFIPDSKYIFTKKLKFESYDFIPVLSLREIPLDVSLNRIIKRIFDIVFSLLVIVGFLSWFTPFLALVIKLESKGSVFFKQLRYGADFNLFACYKFRSMKANKDSDRLQASKNDMRVTKIGKFIRKTSIDELPQFYNVLFGNMSVVGPRPLLLSHTDDYKNKINKFMVRHAVKPGITGLAQVSGYRGNIEKDLDMQNRVRYDIFYVENWSIFLDLKIIILTILNIFKGEEKAY
ncbi:undecaprenyl-phosphate glucose phosphotransferase [Mariniflexile gromovii]|uniref:Undecaprenyl-phosphate glucose phosphotransferase n=1 Tax=Mariniflexile gromovii TaxID=362523 RepID=A0ABS4BQJ0_9FLAO|nr:undecaprenyl-phosphate glucose phosphotransferase [Mariniflexile gromovii]MBP0902853.1 undecaprenyl-phosphate glucose phosphotransferase [Mariniflexile gromovii]